MTRAIRVLVVDDHALHRDGARQILAQDPEFEVVGEAATGETAVTLALRLRPDVVLMDIRLPGISGVEATRRIREADPAIRVLMVSAYDDDEYVRGALQAGASGHLSKAAPGGELVEAIRLVVEGRSVVRQDVLARLIATQAQEGGTRDELSRREKAVLELLSRGLPNRAIAAELHISARTVERHCENLYAKLAVHTRTEAVVRALSSGLVQSRDVFR
ncbi:MAG: DNA-binding response regulator [Cellulomonas sp. 73-145]|uniref:response regulator n=1 Tax=Cellulomonas sp. 73-145 TaxID=1895739 RepID=UPI000926D7F9|nr:response regulator transcription factor [Cellulomonas sp. 73-145]MBN9328335.1 response regulator transcription factor [Cellulomonas sp.]OJV58866.1 MAG: DNA-binding response regulator [Cellulomonas sp. 73-145]